MTDFTGALVAAGIGATIGYGSAFLNKHLRDRQEGQAASRSPSPSPHVLAVLLAVIMGVAFAIMSWQ